MTAFPDLPFAPWQDTCATLHMVCQIVGKYRLAHTPWQIHSWHATLYPTARGLTTGLIPDPQVPTTVTIDIATGAVRVEALGGAMAEVPLRPMSIAGFFEAFARALKTVGATPRLHGAPNEVVDPVPFAQDAAERPLDLEAVRRYHRALVAITAVYEVFRAGFLGKSSPVHLFWGSFDLAVTRFSGAPAPKHPGGIPALPDAVTHEAYSHAVTSTGFWPGGNGADEAMFYAYAYPTPDGFSDGPIAPAEARWDAALGEFLLPYAAVARADDPAATLLAFMDHAFVAAARRAGWDEALDAPFGKPRVVRPLDWRRARG
ncbi:MAG: DUF5996 family protein [Pseudomonadota bacterium]